MDVKVGRAWHIAVRVWARVWWLVPWLLAAAALSVFWSHATPHLCYPGYWFSGDSGVTVYNSWQVAEGKTLYVDIFEFKFPLFFYLWGIIMWIAGPSGAVAQWATLLTVSLVAPIVAVVVQRLGGTRWFATVVGALPPALFFATWPFSFTPWLGWLMCALVAFSLERAYRSLDPDRGWLCRAGMFTGLFVLSIQSIALPFAGGATLALFLVVRDRRWSQVGWFVGGGLLVALPFVLYYVAQGAFLSVVDQTLVWPVDYYYNGYIKGHYPGAGTVEWFQNKGLCKATDSGLLNSLYSTTIIAIPAITVTAFFATLSVLGWLIVRRVRHGADQVARSPFVLVLGVLAGGGFMGFLPHVIVPSLSDMTHISFSALMVAIPFGIMALRGPAWWRISSQTLITVLFVVVAVVYGHRHAKWNPFDKRFHHFDDWIERYAGTQWMQDLTEPGDTIVHMPYGGWQYFTTRPAGVSFTWVFNDNKMHPPRHFERVIRDFRERKPALLFFRDKGLEGRFFGMDPSLRERYFFNGRAWERRIPAMEHVTLAGRYKFHNVHLGELVVTQDGQELHAERVANGTSVAQFVGSVRGPRVYLKSARESYILHQQADASLVGAPPRRVTLTPVLP